MGQVELLYCKSKVYVHPSKSSAKNIPGYLYLVRPANAEAQNVLVSWIPEFLLKQNTTDYDNFVKVDLDADGAVSDSHIYVNSDPLDSKNTHAFSVPIKSLYTLKLRQPSLGWWWGSVILSTRNELTLPALYFHDSESESTKAELKRRCADFTIFEDEGAIYWGGDSFLDVLKKYANLVKSKSDPNVYLVNPTALDLEASLKPIRKPAQSKKEGVTLSWEDAKWSLLEKLANVARFSRNASKYAFERSPRPVRSILNTPEMEQLSRDYDSARLYLAEWSMDLAEEDRKAQNNVVWTDGYETLLNRVEKDYNVVEMAHGVERRNPVTLDEWSSFFDSTGKLCIPRDEVLERIFHGCLEPAARPKAWLFLLEVYPWDSNEAERQRIQSNLRNEYNKLKKQWWDDVARQENDTFWKDQKARIEKDVLRTDRQLAIFAQSNIPHPDPESRFADSGANPHLEQLKDLLITYNEYNVNLGYVQGMTDLLSPLYVVLQDDVQAFWAFCGFMRRMERNFLRDQSGMRDQLSTLDKLVKLMLPKLWDHLERAESTHFFFFFRMLIVWFKREFDWEDALRLWEVLWTDYLSSQFHLFIALAILDLNKDVIMARLRHFDEVLKFINELSMSLDLELVLVRAEHLFCRFCHVVDLIDRNRKTIPDLPIIPDCVRQLRSRQIIEVKELERPHDATGG